MKFEIKKLLAEIENHLIDYQNKIPTQQTLVEKNRALNRLNIKFIAILEGIRQIIEEEEIK